MKDYSRRLTVHMPESLYKDLSILCAIDGHYTFNDFVNLILRDYLACSLTPEKRAALDLMKSCECAALDLINARVDRVIDRS